MRQKVAEKIKTFLTDHGDSGVAIRDDAASLLSDIERDLEGDDAERAFIVRTCVKLRAVHNLTEDLTEPIRDFSTFVDGLELLNNAKDYAHVRHDSSVTSLKRSVSKSGPKPADTKHGKNDPNDAANNATEPSLLTQTYDGADDNALDAQAAGPIQPSDASPTQIIEQSRELAV